MISPAAPGKTAPHPVPENVLYRSRIEIGRILQALVSAGRPVSAEIGDDKHFVSRMLSVDPDTGYFVIAYCANKSLNSALFKQSSLEFTANHQNAHLVFQVSNPSDTLFEERPAIRFALPQSLIIYHRRERPRIPIPADVSLRCIADEAGILPFEARIIDISLDGMGGMLYDRDIAIEAGTGLKHCRIIIPGGKAIITDLEVRNSAMMALPDGTFANRAGLRFIQRPKEIESLINMFVQNLDDKTP
jgi:c-di-GMP-binding flagellar brake protein YcgR